MNEFRVLEIMLGPLLILAARGAITKTDTFLTSYLKVERYPACSLQIIGQPVEPK